jgi:hypothetical protein
MKTRPRSRAAHLLNRGTAGGRRVMPGLWLAITVVEESIHGLDQPLAASGHRSPVNASASRRTDVRGVPCFRNAWIAGEAGTERPFAEARGAVAGAAPRRETRSWEAEDCAGARRP